MKEPDEHSLDRQYANFHDGNLGDYCEGGEMALLEWVLEESSQAGVSIFDLRQRIYERITRHRKE